jgi:hypothetical protein
VIEAIVGIIRTSLERASAGESDLEAVGVGGPREIDQAGKSIKPKAPCC